MCVNLCLGKSIEDIKVLPEQNRPVLIADAYYLSGESRKVLRDNGIRYMCAINCTRFRDVWALLETHRTNEDEDLVAWNSTTQEIATLQSTKYGKKYILTNNVY